ncbi:(d)CMP kinase [Ampullimonas aquatilis]|uniref:(d)CMP kinase n=1 Tax=Ampullimonas aquatilis TaxID=1341549 RepID=UPI003C73E18C
MTIPVITIDGPTASGKGTVAAGVAERLGFHYLDSGALYRLAALAATQAGLAVLDQDIAETNLAALAGMASQLDIRFTGTHIWLYGADVDDMIRTEAVGNLASRLSVFPAIRTALLSRQRDFLVAPGLVADGRDMGTVIFPEAPLKVFLTASVDARAQRRFKQLKEKGISVIFDSLLADLKERDARDSSRAIAPLKPAADAHMLDTSHMSVETAIATVVGWYQKGTD